MDRRQLTKEDVLNIPKELCPMMVFSYGIGSAIATAIAIREHGLYNHFMWLLKPGILATQSKTFHEVHVEDYMERHALKFVYGKEWGRKERRILRNVIATDLAKPWYRRLYDPVAIVGQFFGTEWMQLPYFDICSDKGRYIREIDPEYNLKRPSPTNINNWTKARPEAYMVHGRYRLD